MTNMQLAYSDYLERNRHNVATEQLTASEIQEKIRHNIETENLTRSQQEVQRYLGELDAKVKREQIATNAELKRLEMDMNRAIADAKQNLSEREFAQSTLQVTEQMNKLKAETEKIKTDKEKTLVDIRKTSADADEIRSKTAREEELAKAKILQMQSSTYDSIDKIFSVVIGQAAGVAADAGANLGDKMANSKSSTQSSNHVNKR